MGGHPLRAGLELVEVLAVPIAPRHAGRGVLVRVLCGGAGQSLLPAPRERSAHPGAAVVLGALALPVAMPSGNHETGGGAWPQDQVCEAARALDGLGANLDVLGATADVCCAGPREDDGGGEDEREREL